LAHARSGSKIDDTIESYWLPITAEVCCFEYFTTEDTDFSNTIQNVANAKPDVIFISGYYAQGGPMIRQAKGKWDGIPILGGDGLDSPDLVGLVGDTSAEIYMSSHFAADAPDERVRDFAKRYEKQFGKPPGNLCSFTSNTHPTVSTCLPPRYF